MRRTVSVRLASMLSAAALTLLPSLLQAQKALVYCPVGIDATGCNTVVAALAADAARFPGGAEAGYDGTEGTADLASVDLSGYAVLVVPSLADGAGVQPYALLRNATIAGRIRAAFMGRAAVWSGTPDVGSTNRGAKNELIRNLAGWASADSAGTHGPGVVALQDNSDGGAARYGWLSGISALSITADTTFEVYSNAEVLTATGRTILTNSSGLQIGYTNMASYGLIRGPGASGATDEALGGRTSLVVLVTAAGDPSDPNIATVRTDREDYSPGETVTITGAGWEPGETVSMLLHEDPLVHGNRTLSAVADASGHIFNDSFSPEEHDLGVRFTLTATGGTSGRTAQATFTDNQNPTLSQVQVFESDCTTALTPALNHAVCAKTSVTNQGGSSPADFFFQWVRPNNTVARLTASTTGTNGATLTDILPASSVTVSGTWTVRTCRGNAVSVSTTPCTSNGLTQGSVPTPFVVPANQAPVLAAIGNKTVDELTALTFTAAATDADTPTQTLTFSLDAGAPAGASINSTTGAFSWTPTEAQGPGTYPVTIRVTDNGAPVLDDFETISIVVSEVNVAPILGTIGNKTVDEQVILSFTATATDADLPANSLTFSLVGAPAGASITGSTGAFSWTPTEAQGPGDYTFTVKVTDNGSPVLSDEESITVHVNEVNVAPVITGVPAALTTNELVAVGFDADATDGDTPAQPLSFSLVSGPTGAAIDAGTGVFTWTPTEAQGPGSYPFQVAVSDGMTGTTASITITVSEVNVAPVLAAIGNKTVDEETELTFTASATDADLPANTLTYSLAGTVPAGATIDGSSGVVSWTPTEAQGPADYTFTVKVTDNGSPVYSDEETISVHVDEVNKAPVVTPIADLTVDEETPAGFTATATDPDVPANSFAFSLVGAPAGATIDATSGAFSWTPSEAQGPGVYTFQVRATDDGTPAAFGETTVKITVNEVNVAPVLATVGNRTVDEETALTFTATANDADLPANALTFSLVGAPAGATISTGGAFNWTPTETQGPGSYTLTVKVTDNGSPALSDEETITVTVNEVNEAPVVAAIADQTVDEETALTFTAAATDPDVPANSLAFSLSGAPAGASIDATTGAFNWTPTEAQGPAVYTFQVRATDNGSPVLFGEATVKVTVKEVNKAPTLNAIGDKTADEEEELTFTAGATDPDLPANALTYSLVGAPAGATINGSSGAFSWTPSEAQGPGDYTFTVKVTDDGTPALSDEEEISVHVNEVNVAPELAAIGGKTVDEETTLTFTAAATDHDIPANSLAFSLDAGAPAGASIHPVTGAFSWTPGEADGPGNHLVTIRVTDNGTPVLDDFETVTIHVNEVNKAPTLDAVGNKTVDEETALTFTATATDPDIPANALTFSLVGAPAGASITAAGSFSWTPTEAQGPGSYTLTVKVTDNGSPALSDEETITVTVNEVNKAPIVAAIPDQTVDELTALAFTASAADPDVPANAVIYSLAAGPDPVPAGASINPTTGAFAWTPTEAQGPGVYTFKVVATDDGSPVLAGETTVKITVNEVNVAPVLAAVGSKTVNEETALTFTAIATDVDLPPNALTFSLVGAPAGASIDGSSGAFAWTPSEAQGPGSYTFTVKVTDNGDPALSDEEAITVQVNEINVAPELAAIGNKTVDEETALAFTASATDHDLPANTLTFSLDAGAPAGASINATTGAFTWTPTEAQGPGSYPVSIRVTDNGTPVLDDFEAITITVNEVNLAPVLAAVGNKSVNEETALTFTAAASDADVPANTLIFSLVGAPAGASITGSSGLFSWTPTEAQGPGDYTFTVKVTDNGSPVLSDEETITVHVDEVNEAPVVAAIPSQTVNEASTVAFIATATDQDVPANTLAFSLVGAPAGATIDPATGAFSWTPADDDPSVTPSDVFTFKVRATDNGSPVLFGETSVTITVNNVAPVLAALSGPINPTQVGSPVTVSATFTDVGTKDTHSGIIDWGDGTTGATITETSGSGTASGSHSYSDAGVYTVKLTVTDDDGGSSNQSTFQYVVIYDPAAGFVTGGGWIDSPLGAYRPMPTLTGKANFGFVAKYQKGKSIPDGNTEFQFKAGGLNFKSTNYEWLVISGAKGQYKGYGTINGSGNYRFVLTIEDGKLKGTGVDRFRIRIWGDGSDLGGTGLVYDNQYTDSALGDATTALGGGSVVIHSDAKTASK